MMEYLSICRVCLSENLDNDFSLISDVCENSDNPLTFCDILKMITPQVSFSDEKHLTTNICIECKSMCHEILKFRDQILYSNETLMHPIKNQDEDGEYLEEIITYPIEVSKLEECFTLHEIQSTNEPDLMLTCDEMIVEVDENVYEEEEYNQGTEEYKTNSISKQESIRITDDDTVQLNNVSQTKDNTEHYCYCIVCLRAFNTKKEHDDHMREHKQEINFDAIGCIYCKKFFDKFGTLIRHLKTHEENKTHSTGKKSSLYECNICGKSYAQGSRLKLHLETHSDQKSYLCTDCGKSFSRNSNLRQHLLRHNSNKRFKCAQCPAKFHSKGNLKAHMTSHSNKKPFYCDICGSTFTQSYSLVKHNRIHTGIRPYKCDVCEMKFYSSDHKKRHMRIHTGERPFKCDFCSKSFAQNGDLNKHKRLHIGENTYICDYASCKQSFRLLSELRSHHKIHYENDTSSP